MKLARMLTLTAPLLLAASLNAHAQMSAENHTTFINECVAQAGKSLDANDAKTHCACGAEQVNKNFSDKEISQLNEDPTTPESKKMIARLQTVVAEHCSKAKN